MPSITITDLNNAKLDVDHIAAVATSTASTATDRLGNVKKTMTGASADVAASMAAVTIAKNDAINNGIPAAVASVAAINNRGAWCPITVYTYKDIVLESGNWHACVIPHTSGATFAADSATKWRVYQGVTSGDLAAPNGASLSGYTGIPSSDVTDVERFLNRTSSRFGRVSAADLPRFMATIRGYRHDLQQAINIVGFGSSVGVGATLPDPATQAPVAYFKNRLKAVFDPAGLYNIQASNQSVNGSIAADFHTAWAAMLAAGIATPTICVFAYGMNDLGVAQFNGSQTYPGFHDQLTWAVKTAKNAGADVILFTTPHPSVVNYGSALHSMPAGIAQIYPTTVAANVGPEQLLPPASQSIVTADFVGEGIPISVSHRGLRINDTIRDVGREQGCVVIEAERGWFEGIQTYQAITGSASGAENSLFNTGEAVHPNWLGHQWSYCRGTDEFVYAFSKQISQPGSQQSVAGYGGINTPGTFPAPAVWDVHTPYPDSTTPPMRVWARTGPVGGDGVKTEQLWLEVDPSSGDLKQGNGGWAHKSPRSPDGTSIANSERTGAAYGVNFKEQIQGESNNSTTWTLNAFPDNSVGELTISGQQPGVSTSPQMNKYRWQTKAGGLTLTADGANIGVGVFTVAASGLRAVATALNANTNFQAHWKALGP